METLDADTGIHWKETRGYMEAWNGDRLEDTWIGGRIEACIGDRLKDTWIGGRMEA